MEQAQKDALARDQVFLTGDVDEKMFLYVRDVIMSKLAKGEAPRLTFHISSPGGSIDFGLKIYDMIKFYRGQTVAIVHGMASSSAAMFLQVFDWRTATTHAQVRIHRITTHGVAYETLQDIKKREELVEDQKAAQEEMYRILGERTKKSREEIEETCKRDKPMDADKALAYGLIDQIIKGESDISIPEKEKI